MDFIAADLDVLRAVPSNVALLHSAECREGPTARPDAIPWRVGGYNISTHPDLVEWTAKLAAAVGAGFLFVCGRPAIVAADNRILGWGRGTHDMVILAPGSVAAEILAQRGHVDDRYGPGWLVFPAFLPDLPSPKHIPTVTRWLEAARDA